MSKCSDEKDYNYSFGISAVKKKNDEWYTEAAANENHSKCVEMASDASEPGPVTRYDSKDSLSSDHSSREDQLDEQWLSQVG